MQSPIDLSRRDFLRRSAAAGVMLGGLGSGVLAGCGSSSESQSASQAATTSGSPKRGGTLTVAMTGGSSNDTLDPILVITYPDAARRRALYNNLVEIGDDGLPMLSLAEELTHNKDATVWVLRLRKGVTFHNGKPLTVDDVIYSFTRILDPKNAAVGAPLLAMLDPKGFKKIDSHTLQMTLAYPSVEVAWASGFEANAIVPVGFNPKKPVGTGPFKFGSFSPGQSSTFTRYDNYWQEGKPYVDQLVIDDFNDLSAQYNALVSGSANAAPGIAYATAASLGNSTNPVLIVSKSGGFNCFTMRVDKPPFDDPRVRLAMKYIMDREQIVQIAYHGFASVANDLYGRYDPDYDSSLPQREQNISMAKSLLKQAGQSNLSVELVTCDYADGWVSQAQVLAQQAKAAGVTINVNVVPISTMFGPNYLKWPFAMDVLYGDHDLVEYGATLQAPGAYFNETHWNDPAWTKLFEQARGETNPAARKSQLAQLQKINYGESGLLIPCWFDNTDAVASSVHGFTASRAPFSLNGYDFARAWID